MAHIRTYTSETAFQAKAEFASLADAQAFADSFPKSYLVKAVTLNGTQGMARCRYTLDPQRGNDTGTRRAERFLNKAGQLGHTIEHTFK